ncbi:hypothetical protein V8C37DRAFT_420103 [Trichoderma ceciliae]
MLDERHEDLPNPSNDQNAYTLGSIGKHKVVIAGLPKGRYGNNSSATVATRMISTFPNIRVGLMVGIGGGIPQKTRLGDVVISCPSGSEPGVVQWDMGKAEYGGQFRRTGSLAPPPTALLTALGKFEADQITSRTKILSYLDRLGSVHNVPKSFLKSESLKDVLYEPKYGHVQGDDCRHCDEKMIVQREPREDDMMIHCGLIASGNQVIKDAILRDNLYEKFDKNVLCIEMEAAGLMNDFPCVVIRGICDYADSHKNKKWQDYAAAVAAACAKAFLTVVPASEVDKLQRVQVSITPEILQGARKYMAMFRGDKKGTSTLPTATAPSGEIENTSRDEIPQAPITSVPAPEMVKSKDTASDAKSADRNSHAKPGETSLDGNLAIQSPVEAWLQEASSSLAKMVQEGHVEAAMRNIVVGLSQLQMPREGVNTARDANLNNNPQTPPLSPGRDSYATGGDNGYGHDVRGFGSRSGTFTQTQPWPSYNYRDASTQTPAATTRSQTFPSDPRSNSHAIPQNQKPTKYESNGYDAGGGIPDDSYPRSPPQSPLFRDDSGQGSVYRNLGESQNNVRMDTPVHGPDTRANGYHSTYEDDLPVRTGEPERRPYFSGPSTNMNRDTRQRSGNVNQDRRSPVMSWNNASANANRASVHSSQAFFSAVETGNISVINRLLENGADLEMIDEFGRTPLWCAVQIGRRDVIHILLDKGADTEAQNAYGQTILAWAVEMHRNEIIDILGFT